MKPKTNQFWNETLQTFSSAMIRSSGASVARSEALTSEVNKQTLRPFFPHGVSHLVTCSVRTPLKNTCAFALSAQNLL